MFFFLFFFLPDTLQQQSAENISSNKSNIAPCPFLIPNFLNAKSSQVILKKIALIFFFFCSVVNSAKASSLLHSRLMRSCSSASTLWRACRMTADHSLAFSKDMDMWQQQQVNVLQKRMRLFWLSLLWSVEMCL